MVFVCFLTVLGPKTIYDCSKLVVELTINQQPGRKASRYENNDRIIIFVKYYMDSIIIPQQNSVYLRLLSPCECVCACVFPG